MWTAESRFENTATSDLNIHGNNNLFLQTVEADSFKLTNPGQSESNKSIEFTNPYPVSDTSAQANTESKLLGGDVAQNGVRTATVKQDGIDATFTKDSDGNTTAQYSIGGETVKTKDVKLHVLSGHGLSTVTENYNLSDGHFKQITTPGIPGVQPSITQDEFKYKDEKVRVTTGEQASLFGTIQYGPTFEKYNQKTHKYEAFKPSPADRTAILAQDQKLQNEATELDQKLNKIQNPLNKPQPQAA